jgi:ATP-dependent DNA helicase RecG
MERNICQVSKPTASRYLAELEGTYLAKIGGTGKGTVYVFKGLTNGS